MATGFLSTILEDREGPVIYLEPSFSERNYGFTNTISWTRKLCGSQLATNGSLNLVEGDLYSWMAVDYHSYQPKANTGPQNLLDSFDTCDHGFIGCYREGYLTNSILRFLDSLELHSWRTKNHTFGIFEDDFVYFRKSTWKTLLD